MANWIISQTADLANGINADAFRREIYPLAYPGDDNSHVWQVTITNNGVPPVLQHHTVVAYFFREYDQQTVMAVGQVSGNVASVALPEQVYAYQCRIQAIMRVNYSGTNTTVAAMSFRVGENITGTIIDPGEAIPSLDDLMDEIERMEANNALFESLADTITSKVDSLSASVTGMSERCNLLSNGKINYPVSPKSKYGTSGQVLRTLGDEATEWVDVGLPTDEQTSVAVEKWLDDHPEATTTVQDGAITDAKLSFALTKKVARGNTLMPVYVGDYLSPTTHLPSACLFIDDYFYCFDAPSRDYAIQNKTNNGIIRKFSIADNIEVIDDNFPMEAPIGHANSVAYNPDTGRIFVAPCWDSSSGTEVDAHYLHVYNYDAASKALTYAGEMNTGMYVLGVSFDPVAKEFYYMTAQHAIYRLVDDPVATPWRCRWVLYTKPDYSQIIGHGSIIYPGRAFLQDFAVYDSVFYNSSPYGDIVFGKIVPNTTKLIGAFNMGHVDSYWRYCFGELEGMEFTLDGHLFAVTFIKLSDEVRDAFVVELPVGTTVPYITSLGGNINSTHDNTLTLSEETQKAFSLGTTRIRTILQLGCMTMSSTATNILIPSDQNVVDDYVIRTTQDLNIQLAGTYTAKQFEVYSGQLSLYSDESDNKLTLTSDYSAFECYRAGQIKFAGNQAINLSTPNLTTKTTDNFIAIGTHYPVLTFRLLPVSVEGIDLYISSRKLTSTGIYHGSVNDMYYSYDDTIAITNAFPIVGWITSSSASIILKCVLDKKIPENSTLSVTAGVLNLRGISGYIDGSSTTAKVDLTNGVYTVGAGWQPAHGALTITIKKADGSAFTNVTNNTPIVAEVSTNISVSITKK